MDTNSNGTSKQPLKRIEAFLKQCTDIAIPLHVGLLRKHRANINKFRQLNEWTQLYREQINASRVVEQLKADLVALDQLSNQIIEKDVSTFVQKTKHVEDLVSNVIQEFADENTDIIKQPCSNFVTPSSGTEYSGGLNSTSSACCQVDLQCFDTAELELQRRKAIEASWNSLLENVQDLHISFETLATVAHEQQEDVDSIEQHLTMTDDNVRSGEQHLARALKYKASMYPVAGAAVGGCIGGPLGLVVGFKAAAIAIAIGGLIGYHGGRLFKNKEADQADISLSNFNEDGRTQLVDKNNHAVEKT